MNADLPPTSPPPGWAPPSLSQQDEAPTQFRPTKNASAPGETTARGTKIGDYAPPKTNLWIVLVVVMIIAGMVSGIVFLTSNTDPLAPPTTPTPSSAVSQKTWGLEFGTATQNVTGRWDILEHVWNGSTLGIHVKIQVDTGTLNTVFMAFTDEDAHAFYPAPSPDFSGGEGGTPIENGRIVDGWVYFNISRQNVTLLLSDYYANQLSALPISA